MPSILTLARNTFNKMDRNLRKLKDKGELPEPLWYYKLDFWRCYLVHGASPRDYFILKMYAKSHSERIKCTTYKRLKYIDEALNDYSSNIDLIENKGVFNTHLKDYIRREWLFSDDASEEELIGLLMRQKVVFYKPVMETQGKGIRRLFADKPEDVEFLRARAADTSFVLEEQIISHPEIAAISPYAVNTIRVNTVLDRQGIPHVIHAAIRFSGSESFVDNMCAGGYIYSIDLDSGIIEKPGISYEDVNEVVIHPFTGKQATGLVIPHFHEMIECIKECATKFEKLRYIGWDVAITPDGFDIVEANLSAGMGTLESDGKGKYLIIKNLI